MVHGTSMTFWPNSRAMVEDGWWRLPSLHSNAYSENKPWSGDWRRSPESWWLRSVYSIGSSTYETEDLRIYGLRKVNKIKAKIVSISSQSKENLKNYKRKGEDKEVEP